MTQGREYKYYRTQAIVNKDINILWDHYPDLKVNVDHKQGVNIENNEIESSNYSCQYRLLRDDFDESGGGNLIKLFLEHKNLHWTSVPLPEYKECRKEKEQL